MTLWHCNVAVSLDGKLARPDGSVDWLDAYPPDDAFTAFLEDVDVILMGRGTYEAVRGFGAWPYPGKRTLVLSSRSLEGAPEGVVHHGDDAAALLSTLDAQDLRRVWVAGGGQLVRTLLHKHRIDLLELTVIPVVLGAGIPLFPEGTPPTDLSLVSAAPWIGGALRLVYRPVSGPKTDRP